MYSGTPLDVKKVYSSCSYFISIYNSLLDRYKVTCLIPGNVCVQAEGVLKPMKTLVLIQQYVENKTVILNCHPLLLGESYIEIKA